MIRGCGVQARYCSNVLELGVERRRELVGFNFTFCEGTAGGGGVYLRADRAEAGLCRPQANWYEIFYRREAYWRFLD